MLISKRSGKENVMSDYMWFAVTGVVLAAIGTAFILLGRSIWAKKKTDLIISYHCDKVSEEDKEAYCKLFGIGMIVMGIGFVASGIYVILSGNLAAFIPMAAGMATGIGMMISAGRKYNR